MSSDNRSAPAAAKNKKKTKYIALTLFKTFLNIQLRKKKKLLKEQKK